jgi:hypothetical protein
MKAQGQNAAPSCLHSIHTKHNSPAIVYFLCSTPMEGINQKMSKPSPEHVEHVDDIETTDVIICGCGPTGAMLSAQLGRLGIKNVVLDREPGITEDPRGIALDEDGIRLLQSLGLYDAIYTEIGSCLCYYSSQRYLQKLTSFRHGIFQFHWRKTYRSFQEAFHANGLSHGIFFSPS